MASTIQVDKIQDTGGNTIVESDGSGAATTRIPATYLGSGTASSTTVLYGDQTYKTEPSGGVTGIATSMTSGTGINLAVNGEITMPLQPAFSAQNASSQDNLAIDAWTTLTFATEIFDQNSDYNTSTHTFTAPVTGKYLFSISTQFNNLDADAVYWQIQIKTSNREYPTLDSGNQYDADPTNLGYTFSIIADLDASDTAYIRYYQQSGTAQADLRTESYFTGALLC